MPDSIRPNLNDPVFAAVVEVNHVKLWVKAAALTMLDVITCLRDEVMIECTSRMMIWFIVDGISYATSRSSTKALVTGRTPSVTHTCGALASPPSGRGISGKRDYESKMASSRAGIVCWDNELFRESISVMMNALTVSHPRVVSSGL